MCYRVLIITFSLIYCFNAICCDELLELSCNSNVDCDEFKLPGHKVTCLNDECICNDINGRQINCVPKHPKLYNSIGRPCPCKIENSDCDPSRNVCLCSFNFTASSDKLRCVKRIVALNESCEDNSQCMLADNFSVCDKTNKVCKCQKHFINHHGICLSTVGLGEKCQSDNQCSNKTENSLCSGGRCVCNRGFVANGKKSDCLPAAGYGESCVITDQCRHKLGPGSECYSGYCTCDVRHYLSPSENKNGEKYLCERYVDLGDYCREHNDCYQYHLLAHQQSMECFLGECQCRDGFHRDITNKICFANGVCAKGLSSVSLLVSSLAILLLKFIRGY